MWSPSIESPPQKRYGSWALGIALVLAMGGASWLVVQNRQASITAEAPPTQISPRVKTVTALGRLQPQGDIVRLSAPTAGGTARISQLRVKEGSEVNPGDIIAVLDSRDRLQAAVNEAKSQVTIAQARLAQVQAGSQEGTINAQAAEIARIQAEVLGNETEQREAIARLEAQYDGDIATQEANLRRLQVAYDNAQIEFERYDNLHRQGAVSDSQRDSQKLAFDSTAQQVEEAKAAIERTRSTSQRQIEEARVRLSRIQASGQQQIAQATATLDRVSEVRPVDVQAAQAEVERAQATLKQAEVSLAEAYVRSPQSGVILEIFTRPGEVIGNEGIAEIGRVQQMVAIAEIYESDIAKVNPGQTAKVTSTAIPDTLSGTVERIDTKVRRQNVINADPTSNIDSRVVEAHILLDSESSEKVKNYTNLQVKVVIEQ